MFTIIIINKNNIAIAPTYITIKIKPKKSTLNNISIKAAQQNASIKNIIECIAFIDKNTKDPQDSRVKSKRKCMTNID